MAHPCPFSHPLIGEHFQCRCAQPVSRRGGPGIDCRSAGASKDCEALFTHLKTAALPAFGVADDLLEMPHSVLVRIQHGGLLGLRALMQDDDGDPDAPIGDIRALVETALHTWDAPEHIPTDEIVEHIQAWRVARKGKRRRR